MPRVIYNTASSLNGFIADDANSLDWLFEVEIPDAAHQPHKWAEFFGDRPTFVFTTRELRREQ